MFPRDDFSINGRKTVIIIGAGFRGLTAAYDLSRRGFDVEVLESDRDVGGLSGSFDVGGTRLEKFYHHWFTNDRHVMGSFRSWVLRRTCCSNRLGPVCTSRTNFIASALRRTSFALRLSIY